MSKKCRMPQVPSEPIPELAEFLAPFRVRFRRVESQEAIERYVAGLLTDHPNKNCDTLAEIIPGTTEQQLQGLLTNMVWDEDDLNHQCVQVMLALKTEGDGAIIFDDTGFAKQGQCSVGVARQYSGTLGKVANCQITVNCHYAERTLAWPAATRLYLPQTWTKDSDRRKKAHIPPDITFQTKAGIALGLLDQAKAWGIPHRCVVVDADYGDNPTFLNGLAERRECCVVAIRANFSVSASRRAEVPVHRADQVVEEWKPRQWRTLRWREGSQGWLKAQFAAVRCWRVDGDGTRHIGWLIGQRPAHGETGDWKYFWSDFPANASLATMVEYTHRRYWVEQYHEEAKTELGWAHYQGRLWHGFHRNAVTVMLAYRFLVWMEWKQRSQQRRVGRPRGAFSPSAGSSSAFAPCHPS